MTVGQGGDENEEDEKERKGETKRGEEGKGTQRRRERKMVQVNSE